MEGTMAVVTPWAANFAPGGWMFCAGQQMSIAANTALYALIGTIYGGDGQQSFNLPDMQGRVAIGAGNGNNGLTVYESGQKGGTESNTITISQMAGHTHPFSIVAQMPVNADSASAKDPAGAFPGPGNGNMYATAGGSGQFYGGLNGTAQISIAGSGIPVNNIVPVTCVNYIICVEGIFPSRN